MVESQVTTNTLSSVVITEQLQQRPRRAPDYASENRALVQLAQAMTTSPTQVLQTLADRALELTRAGSAGISVLEEETGEDGLAVFRWWAAAGQFRPLVGTTIPLHQSPCGLVVRENAPQLLTDPARHFGTIDQAPPLCEVLLVPFHQRGKPVGTVWVASHTSEKQFDSEDQRLLTSLANFAGYAVETLGSLHRSEQVTQQLTQQAADRDKAETSRREITLSVERLGRIYDAILSTTPDFAYLFNRAGQFLYANRRLLEVWGRKLEDVIGKTCLELGYEPWHHDMHMREIAQVIATKEPIRGEVNFRAKLTGLGGVYDYIFTPVLGPDGEVEVIAGTTRDVTEKAELTEALAREKENLAKVVDRAPYFILVTRGPEHIVEVANEEYEKLVGRRGFVGQSIKDVIPEVRGQGYFELLDSVYRTAEPVIGNEARVMVGPDGGAMRFVNFAYQALRGRGGEITGVFIHGVDVTELVRQRESLRESKERYQSLFNTMDEGFCVVEILFDSQGTPFDYLFVEVNRAFSQQTGIVDAAGKTIKSLVPNIEPFWHETYGRVALTGQPARFEFQSDSLGRWFEVHAFKVGGPESRRVAILFNDATKRRRAELEREQFLASERAARAEAERASRMKDEFLANLSHEIRTPLNAIIGWSHIVAQTQNLADMRDGIQIIERNARAQAKIVEELLDMSRITSGKVQPDMREVDLSPIISAALDTARPSAEAKEIDLATDLDTSKSVIVRADAGRLQQVLWNLLSNAVKFTPRGGNIFVSLRRVPDAVEISVRDNGEGIRPEFLPFVFDRFRQADASTTRRHGGLGLGLSIVKQLLELHGGSIRVESPGLGQGSTFTVLLPLPVKDAPPSNREPSFRKDRPADLPLASLTGRRVLIVDDEADTRELLKRLLEGVGMVVTSAASAAEALDCVSNANFDLLVSDIGMPDQDGYSLIRRIRALPGEQQHLPAIALTAYAQAEDRARALAAGFQIHLVKPIQAGHFLTRVDALLRK